MLSGMAAEALTMPEPLEEDAVKIEGVAVAAGGAAKKAGPEPILDLIATADIARGEKLSKACAACHSFDKGGPNKVGPNLYGVVGGPKAHMGDFAYSSGLASMGGAWGYADLNKFLWKPKAYISGTKMNYNGIKKPEDRAAMIAWLRTLSGNPDPLPNQAEIDAEKADLAPEAEAASDAAPAAAEGAAH